MTVTACVPVTSRLTLVPLPVSISVLRAVLIPQRAAQAGQAHRRVLGPAGVHHRDGRGIRHRLHLHPEGGLHHGAAALALVGGGAQGELDAAGEVLGRGEAELGQVGGRHAPGAVGLPGAVGEPCPIRHAQDAHRQLLGAVPVHKRRRQVKPNGRVLLTGHIPRAD
ncbi:hypothetical protein ACETIH_09880, partial [Microvirga arabica]